MNQLGLFIKGILLVAGTTIGGGMLALPVLTSPAGFFPSIMVYILCWLFMVFTGLLILEVSLWLGKEANLVTMAEKTLGNPGKIAAWVLYLFLFYLLNLAYVVGCGGLLRALLGDFLPEWAGPLLFLLLFGPFMYMGVKFVAGKLNLILMVGLIVSYLAFVLIGYRYVNHSFLMESHWGASFQALPICFTAFAYQGIVPTLFTYLQRNVKLTQWVIVLGSFIALLTYVVWQWLIFGIVPMQGPSSLAEALTKGQTAVEPLKAVLQHPQIYLVGQCFAFFALVTSFLGVTLGLIDFLADGLKMEKNQKNQFFLCILIFVPVLILAFFYPDIFLEALNEAGGIGCALLLGLLPVLMVWVGRYRLHLAGEYRVFGGKALLVLLALFVLVELFYEAKHLLAL